MSIELKIKEYISLGLCPKILAKNRGSEVLAFIEDYIEKDFESNLIKLEKKKTELINILSSDIDSTNLISLIENISHIKDILMSLSFMFETNKRQTTELILENKLVDLINIEDHEVSKVAECFGGFYTLHEVEKENKTKTISGYLFPLEGGFLFFSLCEDRMLDTRKLKTNINKNKGLEIKSSKLSKLKALKIKNLEDNFFELKIIKDEDSLYQFQTNLFFKNWLEIKILKENEEIGLSYKNRLNYINVILMKEDIKEKDCLKILKQLQKTKKKDFEVLSSIFDKPLNKTFIKNEIIFSLEENSKKEKKEIKDLFDLFFSK